ncbi:hypothetical protein Lal_00048285 [Lupinus albus]|nr:hypothetical protein Lal_00048285 [Lupinus albus]
MVYAHVLYRLLFMVKASTRLITGTCSGVGVALVVVESAVTPIYISAIAEDPLLIHRMDPEIFNQMIPNRPIYRSARLLQHDFTKRTYQAYHINMGVAVLPQDAPKPSLSRSDCLAKVKPVSVRCLAKVKPVPIRLLSHAKASLGQMPSLAKSSMGQNPYFVATESWMILQQCSLTF